MQLSPALIFFLLMVVACGGGGGGNSPTEPNCVSVAGAYNILFSNSCGAQGTGVVVVAQSGCNFSAVVAVQGGGSLTGTLNGSTGTFTLTFANPCAGSATGTAVVSGNGAINGTFSGSSACCNPLSGSFTLTH